MEYCPICGGLAQVQATRVISCHPVTKVKSTVQRYMRCKDPECLDEKGVPPSWKISTEFIGWCHWIPHDPIKLLQEKEEQLDLFNSTSETPPDLNQAAGEEVVLLSSGSK